MTYRNGGDLLVEVLRAAGVDTVFGVISIHNLPLIQEVSAQLRFVPTRDEAAAVNAADGYARARGALGCAITSTGTGAGNAAGSLIEALTAASSVLHVTGQIPTDYLGQGRGFIHETKDQAGMLDAVSHRTHTVEHAEQAAQVLPLAVAQALGLPGGPVSVEWPIDLQYAAISTPVATICPVEPGEPDLSQIREIAELLRSAQRPVVWAGGGAVCAGAALGELVDRLGAAVFTSNSGRGVVPEDHPMCVGNYAGSPDGQRLLDEADVLLSVGTHFRSNETHSYRLRVPAAHVQVDVDPNALGRCYPIKIGVSGDARAVLSALLDALPAGEVNPEWITRTAEVRAGVRAAQRRSIGTHAAICDAIRAALPRDGVVARDVTIASSSWGNRLFAIYDPRTNIFARGGGIGQGLAMGIGAALALPQTQTVVLAGDGGLVVHLGEILTLVQEKPRVTLIVFNDGGYGVLRNLQVARGEPPAGVELVTPDFGALAGAVGLAFRRVADASNIVDTISAAIASPCPTLVEIDLLSLEPMPTPFVPPVDTPSG